MVIAKTSQYLIRWFFCFWFLNTRVQIKVWI